MTRNIQSALLVCGLAYLLVGHPAISFSEDQGLDLFVGGQNSSMGLGLSESTLVKIVEDAGAMKLIKSEVGPDPETSRYTIKLAVLVDKAIGMDEAKRVASGAIYRVFKNGAWPEDVKVSVQKDLPETNLKKNVVEVLRVRFSREAYWGRGANNAQELIRDRWEVQYASVER